MTIFEFLNKYDIKFHNRKLIEQAFMHSSYVNEHNCAKGDNERLEFMGDAVLQIYSADKLYHLYPNLDEGKMTMKRANLVCERALATYVREHQLNKYLKLGVGEEKNGGRDRDSIIADMFEAFIGAVYLDSDYYNVTKLLEYLIADHFVDGFDNEVDYKTKLQEYAQADKRKAIDYEVIKVEGPSNEPIFTIEVKIDGLVYGLGRGHSKKEAQKLAAKNALEKMVKK